mmetsp:Transcript_26668/g.40493  ORF Transcript_26668/g.40493 Transcript_26668/m.40493 type:complete len:279 (+) Transcript_26668:252-1088(+)
MKTSQIPVVVVVFSLKIFFQKPSSVLQDVAHDFTDQKGFFGTTGAAGKLGSLYGNGRLQLLIARVRIGTFATTTQHVLWLRNTFDCRIRVPRFCPIMMMVVMVVVVVVVVIIFVFINLLARNALAANHGFFSIWQRVTTGNLFVNTIFSRNRAPSVQKERKIDGLSIVGTFWSNKVLAIHVVITAVVVPVVVLVVVIIVHFKFRALHVFLDILLIVAILVFNTLLRTCLIETVVLVVIVAVFADAFTLLLLLLFLVLDEHLSEFSHVSNVTSTIFATS